MKFCRAMFVDSLPSSIVAVEAFTAPTTAVEAIGVKLARIGDVSSGEGDRSRPAVEALNGRRAAPRSN